MPSAAAVVLTQRLGQRLAVFFRRGAGIALKPKALAHSIVASTAGARSLHT